VRFKLLGAVQVADDEAVVDLRGPKARTVLAVLALQANHVVSLDRLVDAVWGREPPPTGSSALYNLVLRLRRALGPAGGDRLAAVAPGYLLRVEPGELDIDVFDGHCARGRLAARSGDWAVAAAEYAAGLGLWYGKPMADLPDQVAGLARARLEEARLQALEARLDADLRLGRHVEVIGELLGLTAEHPLRQGFHEQLMLALFRGGRKGEALDAYLALRRTMLAELGLEPSGSIRQLQAAIARGDAEPAVLAPAPVTVIDPPSPRHQLPAGTGAFTGRAAEFARVLAAADAPSRHAGAPSVVAPTVCVIDGMGGVGKTALAVRAAHAVKDRFPGGELFLDLHGYTAGMAPLAAQDALEQLLRALDVPSERIPPDLAGRAALWRSRLTGSRTLLVLDNAASTAQVRPLLPADPGCLVLITSRRRLTGLDDAHCVSLDVLGDEEAADLLRRAAGTGRIEPGAPEVAELVRLCGNMPLAIRIAASRLRHRSMLDVAALAARMRDERRRLEHLRDDERDLTAVFASSYASLPAEEARLLRYLGLVPGPDFGVPAVAELLGSDRYTAEHLLESLLDHNLLLQHTEQRFTLHDLLRGYARSLGARIEPGEREQARGRLLDYYQRTAQAADRLLPDALRRGERPAAPTDQAEALAWMRAERENLLAAVGYAAEHGLPERVVALTAALAALLYQDGPWPEALRLHERAEAAARLVGDREELAYALIARAVPLRQLSGREAADALVLQARELLRELGRPSGEAVCLYRLGRSAQAVGDYPTALRHYDGAVALYREAGDRGGQAGVLTSMGRLTQATGDPQQAGRMQEAALALYQETGNSSGQAGALYELGRVRTFVGDGASGLALLHQALAIYRSVGHRNNEAHVLWELGHTAESMGAHAMAVEHYEQARLLFEALGERAGAAVSVYGKGTVLLRTGEVEAARELLGQALAVFRDMGLRHAEANAGHQLGRALHARGELVEAAALLAGALEAFEEVRDPQGRAQVLISIGALAAARRDPDRALAGYRRAVDLAREAHSPRDEADALEGAARCAAARDPAAALADMRAAAGIYRRLGAAEADAAEAFAQELAERPGLGPG
jgi:DNA-binding SARP family transcriptional activator/tetratricopeptide (TPR) repeat protein